MMPPCPIETRRTPDGIVERRFDANGDGQADYVEIGPEDQRIAELALDTIGDGILDTHIRLDQTSPTAELLIILDSVPFELVADAWHRGRFRLFHPPVELLSTFPVMTDLALSELFGVSPCRGVESSYYDGKSVTTFTSVYFAGGNAPWLAGVPARLAPIEHGPVYLSPTLGLKREFEIIARALNRQNNVAGYSVATSALGSKHGYVGHHRGLVMLDRFCQALMQRFAGQLHITLLSDHGHNRSAGTYFDLKHHMRKIGYRPTSHLTAIGDVVIPAFSPVSCSAIYTAEPERVCADVVGFPAIDIAMHSPHANEIHVYSQSGFARIINRDGRYAYDALRGDPLQLGQIVSLLKHRGELDADGFADDSAWFSATADHVYPDPLARVWRAFNGLMIYPPQVLISTKEGHFCGNAFLSKRYPLVSAHGGLRREASIGFAMTTAGILPDILRMEDLIEDLEAMGLHPRAALPSSPSQDAAASATRPQR
jgi:hypothetical protein